MTGKMIFSGIGNASQGTMQIDLKVKPAAGLYMLSVGSNPPVKLVVE